jgi:hypothetical protein
MFLSKIFKACVALCMSSSFIWAQTELTVQSTDRPLDMDIVGPVMEAASDDASAAFHSEHLPILRNFVQENLSEQQVLADVSGIALDPDALLLTSESNVRVYMIAEGARKHNTLGFTTESVADGEVSDPLLVFPDASVRTNRYFEDPSTLASDYRTEDTPLVPGDFVDLGVYEAGTMIDFFMIADGAQGGETIFTADPEENPDLIQHVVAFAIPDSPYLLIGFEDIYNGGDRDYNDLVFAVDIGEMNVSYLANPEPEVWLMMALVLAVAYRCHKRNMQGGVLVDSAVA